MKIIMPVSVFCFVPTPVFREFYPDNYKYYPTLQRLVEDGGTRGKALMRFSLQQIPTFSFKVGALLDGITQS